MLLHTLVVGFEVNCYILGSEQENEAIVIDAGAEARRIFDVIEERQLDVKSIVCTHGHYDHIAGASELSELTGARIMVHEADKEYLGDTHLNLSEGLGLPVTITDEVIYVRHGDIIKVGEMRLRVLHTPGHTPGSISIEAGEGVFCGDLIFSGSVGRVDLPGGSWEQLISSVRDKIFTLPERLTLYPGHGPSTIISEEKRYNPYLIGL